ncbi:MAG: SlyX family protein [Saccharospirillum sp.]|nr:SlyX family protein [Saccharospirillum sp.]
MSSTDTITELEIRITHMDDSLEQLNQVIVGQQKQIDRLERLLKAMAQDQEALKEALPEIPNQPPPHY